MSQLEIRGINPIRTDSWVSLLSIVRVARWELTCGLCRERWTTIGSFVRSSVGVPSLLDEEPPSSLSEADATVTPVRIRAAPWADTMGSSCWRSGPGTNMSPAAPAPRFG